MKPITPLVLLALACLVPSCGKRITPKPDAKPATTVTGPGYCLPASSLWPEEEYTQWMTRAELQYFQEKISADQYFAHVEGRNNGGLNEYRAVRKALPADQHAKGAVYWGISDKELFDNELRLLRTGFVRKSMQVFVDASGNAMHQCVWLKPIGTTTELADHPPVTPATPPGLPDLDSPDPEPATDPSTSPPPSPPPPPTADTPVEEKPPVAVVVSPPKPPSAIEDEPPNPKKFTTYTVVSGDVLEKIAKRHHTTAEAIMAANNLANDNLSIGQKLKIPKK
jgi:hypothetical protein